MGYSKLGQCILEHKHIELVQSVTINEAPKLRMTRTVHIPARSIAVLNTMCNIEQTHLGQIYKNSLDHLIQNEYPNLVTISAVHCMDALVQTGIPLIVLDLGTYSIELQKDLVVGYLDNKEIDISEINTDARTGLSHIQISNTIVSYCWHVVKPFIAVLMLYSSGVLVLWGVPYIGWVQMCMGLTMAGACAKHQPCYWSQTSLLLTKNSKRKFMH